MSVRVAPSAKPSAQPPRALSARSALDAYEIECVVARSAWAVVYRACLRSTGEVLAIKEYLPEALVLRGPRGRVAPRSRADAEAFERGRRAFADEAAVLAATGHPALLRVRRVFPANGTVYRLMDFAPGPNLRDHRRALGAAPAPEDFVRWVDGLLGALAALHARHGPHGAVRATNILLRPGERALLLDFDAVRRTLAPRPDAAPATPAADLRALAAVLHDTISGEQTDEADAADPASHFEPLAEVWRRERGDASVPPALQPCFAAIDACLIDGHAPQSVAAFIAAQAGAAPPGARAVEALEPRPRLQTPAVAAPEPVEPEATQPVDPGDIDPADPGAPADGTGAAAPAASAAPPATGSGDDARIDAGFDARFDAASDAAPAARPEAEAPTGPAGADPLPAFARARPRRAVDTWQVWAGALAFTGACTTLAWWAWQEPAEAPPAAAPRVAVQAAPLAAPTAVPLAVRAPGGDDTHAAAAAPTASAPVVGQAEAPPPVGLPVPAPATEPRASASLPTAASDAPPALAFASPAAGSPAPPAAAPAAGSPAPPAAAPAAAPAAPRRPRPTPLRSAAAKPAANTPRESCGARSGFALYQCMQMQCAAAARSRHPQCERLRLSDAID